MWTVSRVSSTRSLYLYQSVDHLTFAASNRAVVSINVSEHSLSVNSQDSLSRLQWHRRVWHIGDATCGELQVASGKSAVSSYRAVLPNECTMTDVTQDRDGPMHPKPSDETDQGDISAEMLERFPQVFPLGADIPKHQLGWRMAVLPFRAVGAPGGYGLAFGMAEEISAAISRFRSPRLMATATFWDGTGPAADVLGRCRMYGLDYILDGTIEVVGPRVHINAVLLDVVLDFEVIWTGTFDGAADDLFSLQDRVATETVRQIDPDLFVRGPVSVPPVRTPISKAHTLVLSGMMSIFRLEQQNFMQARDLLLRAIELDPNYASAHAWLAYWSIMAVGQGWVREPKDVTALAGASAGRAVQLDPTDARALTIAGHVKGYFLHDVAGALELHEKAITLSPNLPIAWTLSSIAHSYNGEHSIAIRHATISHSLSPRDPHTFLTENALLVAHFFNRDLEHAKELADLVLARSPGHRSGLNVQLAILGHMSRLDEAVGFLAAYRKIDPDISVSKIVDRIPLTASDRTYYSKGLRLAGVPI